MTIRQYHRQIFRAGGPQRAPASAEARCGTRQAVERCRTPGARGEAVERRAEIDARAAGITKDHRAPRARRAGARALQRLGDQGHRLRFTTELFPAISDCAMVRIRRPVAAAPAGSGSAP